MFKFNHVDCQLLQWSARTRLQGAPVSDQDAHFAGSIPAIYEHYLVPLLFEPYARELAARLHDLQAGNLLEIAAGTGAVTRALAKALPPTVKITATDLNEAMLRVASSRAGMAEVTWQQADAQQLPFADASFDAVVCQFGMMFLPDKLAGYREALRVLRSGGRYIFSVWDRIEQNELADIVTEAVAVLFPADPPHFLARTPHGHFDLPAFRQGLESVGFARVSIDTVERSTRAPSAEHVAVAYCKGTPLRGEIEARNPARLDDATAAATRALVERFGDGAFDHRMCAHVVTAWR
jgi:ubiquinone/menaquinone biosynthesis C-methylase UbiE